MFVYNRDVFIYLRMCPAIIILSLFVATAEYFLNSNEVKKVGEEKIQPNTSEAAVRRYLRPPC